MSITVNPWLTTNAQNSFDVQTDGFVQGVLAYDNPGLRYLIEGGQVASAQSTPIWGGLPLTLTVVAPGSGGSSSGLGSQVATAATTGANIEAWCLMNGASAGVISTSSQAPLYPAGSSVNFARIGSGLYIALPLNPSAVATLENGLATQAIYWDFTNHYVDTSGTGALGYQIVALNTNSKTISYNSGTSAASWVSGGSVIVVRI